MSPVQQILAALHQKPVAFYPLYRHLMESTAGGLILSQLMFKFSSAGHEGFFYTDQDIFSATGVTPHELRQAKERLKALPFIELSLKGVPAQTWWEIDWEIYETYVGSFLEGKPLPQFGEALQTGLEKLSKLYR